MTWPFSRAPLVSMLMFSRYGQCLQSFRVSLEACFFSCQANVTFLELQMFPPLTVGASLVLAESKGHLDPSYIVNLLVQHNVNEFIFSVPTLVRPMILNTFAQCCYHFEKARLLNFFR